MIEWAMFKISSSARVAVVSGFSGSGRTNVRETSLDDTSLSAKTAVSKPSGWVIAPRSGAFPGSDGLRMDEKAASIFASISLGSMSPTTMKVMRSGV